jgi:SAM-dependent methyltransferase
MSNTPSQLTEIYERRFKNTHAYRFKVWQVLISSFFSKWINKNGSVLDLGCGFGEFINNIQSAKKYAMDLNPATRERIGSDVQFIEQDCSSKWPLSESEKLDLVFTSNFFEHLPNKKCLSDTLNHAYKALKPGGRLIAMGPNIKYLTGLYWDFYDHHVILTEESLAEALEIEGFEIEECIARFLPYTMVGGLEYPLAFIKAYLCMPFLWWIKGRQFLVVAKKPLNS